MKIQFNDVLNGIDGKPLMKDKDNPLTLKDAAVESLMIMDESDRRDSGDEKIKRYDLALKIYQKGEIEITPEDAAVLKSRIGKCYGPAVVGPAYRLLNG